MVVSVGRVRDIVFVEAENEVVAGCCEAVSLICFDHQILNCELALLTHGWRVSVHCDQALDGEAIPHTLEPRDIENSKRVAQK